MPNSKDLRPDEEHVRQSVARHLGVPVDPHDDNSADGMYDLTICYPDRPHAPLEVTSKISAAASAAGSAAAKVGNGWDAQMLTRSWHVLTDPAPNIKALSKDLEKHLCTLEMAGHHEFHGAVSWHDAPEDVLAARRSLCELKVQQACSWEVDPASGRRPRIELLLEMGSWSWDGSADHIVGWVEQWVRSHECADNRRKLTVDGAAEAHLAVFVHMSGVPGQVWRALADTDGVPKVAPFLPLPVTHLWLFARPGLGALGYAPGAGWFRFDMTEDDE